MSRRTRKLAVTRLESRDTPATFTVSNTFDAGAGSLRQAILDANSSPGADAITFDIGTGAKTIQPVSELPAITEQVSIDGGTQGGFAGKPLIEIDGSLAGAGAIDGLTFAGHTGSTVRSLVINRFAGAGILIGTNAGLLTITGNYIGTDAAGAAAAGNAGGGVVSQSDSTGGNVIGDGTAAGRNVISGQLGSAAGVVAGPGDVVAGNFIGTNAGGTAAVPNGVGVLAQPGPVVSNVPVTIGGTAAGSGNLVSGNRGVGVLTASATGFVVVIQGNRIGTDAGGTAAIPNGSDGIRLQNPGGTTVGGPTAAGRNLISGNAGAGVLVRNADFDTFAGPVFQNNLIGTDAAGTAALGNGGFGIDISGTKGTITNLQVGGAGAGNTVSGNGLGGIRAVAAVPGVVDGLSLQGNRVGTSAAGTAAVANTGNGVELTNLTAPRVGGTAADTGNVVSGNTLSGLRLTDVTNATIQGNRVGTNAAGGAVIPNGGSGVYISSAVGGLVGGPVDAARNVLSGNAGSGLAIDDTGTGTDGAAPAVQGNYIGLDAGGTLDLGNGRYGVEISASRAPLTGVVIGGEAAGAGNVIGGNAFDGVALRAAAGGSVPDAKIQGNRIGTNAAGTAAVRNDTAGISADAAAGLLVGGTAAGAGNLISGNGGDGVLVRNALFDQLAGPVVQGNTIGTDLAGTAALPNGGNGVDVGNAKGTMTGVLVGGTAAGAGNTISGNLGRGVNLVGGKSASGADLPAATVAGNRIGTDPAGGIAVGNGGAGVAAFDLTGLLVGPGNLISGNGDAAILLSDASGVAVRGNTIGLTLDGSAPLTNVGNAVSVFASNRPSDGTIGGLTAADANRLAFRPAAVGVNLQPVGGQTAVFGIVGNRLTDFARGIRFQGTPADAANENQPSPVLTAVSLAPNGVRATGTLAATPNNEYRIEFVGDQNGGTVLGSTTVTTDAGGNAAFAADLAGAFPPNTRVSATATRVASNATSPFAAAVTISGGILTGSVFLDNDRSGSKAAGDPPGVGFTVYADANGNGVADPSEVTATSGADGGYTLAVPTDGSYAVRLQTKAGFARTTADPGAVVVGGGATLAGGDFGVVDTTATIAATPVSIDEGDVGAADAVVTLTRTGNTNEVLAISYATRNGTAEAGTDYTSRTGSVTFLAGQTAVQVRVPVRGNTRLQANRTFDLVLTAPAGVTLPTGSSVTITIRDDDAPATMVAVVGATPQTAVINTLFGNKLGVEVRNARGNAVIGADVTFAPPGGGAAGGSFDGSATVTTDAAGRATASDFRANGTAGTFTVTASAAGTAPPVTFTLTNSLTPLGENTPPTIGTVPDQRVAAGGTLGPLSFTIGDGETPADRLTVSASSSNWVFVPPNGVALGGSGTNRTITLTPVTTIADVGTTTITLTVIDEAGRTASSSFVVTVEQPGSPGNTAPTISDVADQTLAAGAASPAIPFTVGDAQTDPGALSVTASSSDTGLIPNGNIVIGGSGANRTVTLTPTAGRTGTATITLTVTDAGGLSASDTFVVTVREAPVTRLGARQYAIGSGAGGNGAVLFYDPNQVLRFSVTPFPGFTGGVRTAAADFNGDGVADLVVGTGPGRATRVRVLDGKSQTELFAVDPFEATFVGGVYVAAGDIDGDGRPDLVITPDEGGGPRVDIYSGAGFSKVASFFGIDDANFRGGARAAVGDITGDQIADLVVAAGFGGGPRIAGFDGPSAFANAPRKVFGDFFAFEQALRNGTFVAVGDLDADGFADVITGGGPGGGPRVLAFSGARLLTNEYLPLANFFAGDTNNRGGVRLAVKDLDGDARADLLAGAGDGGGSRVTGYRGSALGIDGGPAAFTLDAFPGATNGVFVG